MEHEGGIATSDYTTEYRLYDSRLGRWLSVDPKANLSPEESTYCGMGNNPISNTDPDGDIWNVVVGAVAGATVEYGSQVVSNYVAGRANPFSDNISYSSIAIAAVEGGATSGASAIRSATTKIVVKTAVTVTAAVVKNTVDVTYVKGELKTTVEKNVGVIATKATIDIVAGKAIGAITPSSKAVQSQITKVGVNQGQVASAAKTVIKTVGVDITRQINTTVKSAAGTFVKAAANTGSATVSTAIKGTTANPINNFKQFVTK